MNCSWIIIWMLQYPSSHRLSQCGLGICGSLILVVLLKAMIIIMIYQNTLSWCCIIQLFSMHVGLIINLFIIVDILLFIIIIFNKMLSVQDSPINVIIHLVLNFFF